MPGDGSKSAERRGSRQKGSLNKLTIGNQMRTLRGYTPWSCFAGRSRSPRPIPPPQADRRGDRSLHRCTREFVGRAEEGTLGRRRPAEERADLEVRVRRGALADRTLPPALAYHITLRAVWADFDKTN
jgi:hypothetical protein